MKIIGEERIREILADACSKAGSQSAWAKQAGVSQVYINQVLKGHRPAGNRIAKLLNYESINGYKKID